VFLRPWGWLLIKHQKRVVIDPKSRHGLKEFFFCGGLQKGGENTKKSDILLIIKECLTPNPVLST